MRLTERAHHILRSCIQNGDTVIDATAGNGHDTQLLTQLVQPTGHVIAIDIQAAAIQSTHQRLTAHNASKYCQLIHQNHNLALAQLTQSNPQKIRAIIFNLGYLPGSDKTQQTTPADTLPALNSALQLLLPQNGHLLVTAYRAHPGGQTETTAIQQWMHAQDPVKTTLNIYDPHQSGQKTIPPILFHLITNYQ